MVVCKFFQQGVCRFGQFCRFEHTNYGNNQNERNKAYGDGKSVVLGVAEEILASERGGQWLLSCFGPFREQPCIPGMEDVSPEEVRWEMYQAQKNGTVDQTKLQFQQLCQAMNAKHDALKNPSHETVTMLEKLQKGNKDNAFGSKNNFALATPQLANSNSGTNVFASSTFSTANGPFGGGFSSSPAATSTSVFSRTNTNSSSVFGAQPSFGGNPLFGGQAVSNSIFSNSTPSTTSVFGGTQQNMPTFGSAAQSSASFLTPSTNSQSLFRQSTTFGGVNQQNTVFPTVQLSTQSNTLPFSNTTQGATTVFGGTATIQPSTSMFAASVATPASSSIGSTSIFGPPKTTAAFGAAPIFGAAATFGAATQTSSFGGAPAFNNSASVFGTTTATSTFGSNAQTTNSFSALSIPTQNTFNTAQNSKTFGNIAPSAVSTSAVTTFGAASTTTANSFGNVSFATPATAGSPFSRVTPFGSTATESNNSTSVFGPAVSTPPKFGSVNTGFASIPPSTPFASTTMTTTTSNPFAPRSQQLTSFPSTPSGTTFGGMSASPFINPTYASQNATIIDNGVYSVDIDLTDDEKNMYMSDQFILGKIPLKPPTIELR